MDKTEGFLLSKPGIRHLYSNKNLLCICDAAGKVLEYLNRDGFVYPSLLARLFKTGNLKSFFDLEKLGSLDDLPQGRGTLEATASYFEFSAVEAFYSTLPMINIRLNRIGKDRYLGIVFISDLVPNFFQEKTNSVFLIDSQENLVGFNQTFYRLFSHMGASPMEMLKQPVRNFLNPTPGKIQEMFFSRVPSQPGGNLSEIYTRDLGKAPLGEEVRATGPASLSQAPQGAVWENKSTNLSYITLAREIDMRGSEIVMEIDVTVREGHAPVFILGAPPTAEQSPDEHGYLMGRHGVSSETVLKKEGYLLVCRDDDSPKPREKHTLRFFYSRQCFFMHADKAPVLAFYDLEQPLFPRVVPGLGLRGGCACVLHALSIKAGKAAAAGGDGQPEHVIVKTKGRKPGYFIISRFYNNALNSTYHRVQGFTLQNVTGIQYQVEHLKTEYEKLLKTVQGDQETFVGSSPAMTSLKAKARVLAGSRATVLLQGATGTGKEVMARYIHANSNYAGGPFIKVDCSTLPRELMESELFGHEKGSFTGAIGRKTGMFEQANRGTLFLDEVANLTPEAQAKLLQFLEGFTITRIGGTRPIHLDLRVIAASNVPLQALVKEGLFREDLYFRLFVVVMNIPALRERREDLADLCAFFLGQFNEASKKQISGISADAYKKIYDYAWPGNIRELRNVIQRAVLFCEGKEITADDIVLSSQEPASMGRAAVRKKAEGAEKAFYHVLSKMDREALLKVVRDCKGNIARIAKVLGVSRRALYYHFERTGIDVSQYR